MAKFLNSSGISYHLENLIKNSKQYLFLISPFLKFNKRIKDLLDDKNNFRIDIKIIYGKVDLQTEESNWLKSKEFIKVLFRDNLHAKCYMNEKEAIITSMNLYDFSQQNNNEMGIYVTKEEDENLYLEIYEEVSSLIRTSEHVSISIEKVEVKKEHQKVSKSTGRGYCIRCGTEIKLDPEHPLCKKCYQSWSQYSDPTYEEKFCHVCGKEANSSMEKPICYLCYKKLNKQLV